MAEYRIMEGQPERRLMAALLYRACGDYALYRKKLSNGGGDDPELIEDYNLLRDWFKSDRADYLYDFRTICDVISIDYKIVRDVINQQDLSYYLSAESKSLL